MAFNGSGTFVRLYDWTADRDAGVKIRADRMDDEFDGIASGLSTCLTRDGQSTVTANIPMNSKKITGLAAATGAGDAVRYEQVSLLAAQSIFTKTQSWAKGADVVSATALTLGTDGNEFDITGTTTITSIGTLGVGTWVKLHFDAALTFTHHATDLICPYGLSITTAAGTEIELYEYAAGDWIVTSVLYATQVAQRQSLYLDKHGADIASATTLNLDTSTGDLVDVTGTTTITAITLAEGVEKTVRFTGILTLTHGASLVLPGAANITTAAGDFAVFHGYAAGVVRCSNYTQADGTALVADPVPAAATQAEVETGTSTSVFTAPGRQHFHPGHPKAAAVWGVDGTLDRGYNCDAMTDTGAGDWTVNFTTDFSGVDYILTTGHETSTNSAHQVQTLSKAAGTVRVIAVTAAASINETETVTVSVSAQGDFA